MKPTFIHVSGLPPPNFDLKKPIYKVFSFLIEISWGKIWDMHKRAIQGPQRTFMHVSGLLPPYFDKKTKYFINCFF